MAQGLRFDVRLPYGPMDWTVLLLHAFWDSWIHERDVLLARGEDHRTNWARCLLDPRRKTPARPTKPEAQAAYCPYVYTQCMLAGMSVPMALLGLLDRQPSHGYDLKRDYDDYFSRGRPLPYGQVYATLARLARDGKAIAGEAEPGAGPDRKRYTITETGKIEVEAWIVEPIPAEPYLQTDLFVKVVLSLMLGRPAEEYLDAQRAVHLRRMRELTDLKHGGPLVDALLADHGLFHLEADLRWIDLTAARLAALAEEVAS